MNLTFSSLFSMIVFNNILIIIIYFLLKNYKLIVKAGIKLILFCVFLVTFRFFLPFEFSFMKTIPVKRFLPQIYILIHNASFSVFNYTISLASLLAVIWFAGIILILVKSLISYVILLNKVDTCEPVTDSKTTEVLNKVNSTYHKRVSFQMIYSKSLEAPFIFRLRSPVILIPKIELSENEWSYIISHEVAHYYHKDLFYKTFAELLSILYWWNPFIYLLKNQIENLLEINIDLFITKGFPDGQKLDYLDCMLKIIQICGNGKRTYTIAAFYGIKSSAISKRVNIILAGIKGARPALQIITLISSIIITVLTCSFCFILEPYAIPAKDAGNTFEINDYDNYYMIDNNNGSYDLYYNSQYIVTVYEIFDNRIKVYH